MKAIVRSSEKFQVRILRPLEWEQMRDALDSDMKKICTSLLVTGMRYAELKRFRENPDWLEGKFIHLPRGSMLKVKAKQKERAIRLSDMGRTIIGDLFQVPHPLPELPAFDMKLKRLSKRILEGAPVNNKTFRKTWESWLVFYYPEKALQIASSQGHTTATQYEHYLNIPFDEDDRREMRKWVEGRVCFKYSRPIRGGRAESYQYLGWTDTDHRLLPHGSPWRHPFLFHEISLMILVLALGITQNSVHYRCLRGLCIW